MVRCRHQASALAISAERVDRSAGFLGCLLRVHAREDILGERHLDVGDLEIARRQRARSGIVEMLQDSVRPRAVRPEEGVRRLDVRRNEIDDLAVDILAGQELDESPGRFLVRRIVVDDEVPAPKGADRCLSLGRGSDDELPSSEQTFAASACSKAGQNSIASEPFRKSSRMSPDEALAMPLGA